MLSVQVKLGFKEERNKNKGKRKSEIKKQRN
jgi:hypothetical protein